MAKQCSECGAVADSDVTPYCESCGGKSWTVPMTLRPEVGFWRVVYITGAIAVMIATVYWLVVRR